MREWVLATKSILEHWQHGTPLRFDDLVAEFVTALKAAAR